MKAILSRFIIKNMIEFSGDDIVFIDIYYKTVQKPEILMLHSINYDKFHRFIKTVDVEAYNYLFKIRRSIGGYGPKHGKIFEVMDAENFDLQHYIHLFLATLSEDDITQNYERCEALTSKNNQETAEVLAQLDSHLDDDYRAYNITFAKFRDEVDEKLHEVMLTHFPTFFENDATFLKEYRKILIDTTLSFTEKIDNLIFKAENDDS